MDADLQQEPETLLAMYQELICHPEADCVAAYQSTRHEGALKALLKRAFYRVFKGITQGTSGMIAGASDFRVFRHCVAEGASLHARVPPLLQGALCLGGL